MVYNCNICKRNFNSSTFEDLNAFCKHVASCPVRSENFLVERFTCSLCDSVVKYRASYQNHLIRCQPPTLGPNSSTSQCTQDPAKNTLKERRAKGELVLRLMNFLRRH